MTAYFLACNCDRLQPDAYCLGSAAQLYKTMAAEAVSSAYLRCTELLLQQVSPEGNAVLGAGCSSVKGSI